VSNPEPSDSTTTEIATTPEPDPTTSDTVPEPIPTDSATTEPTPESPSQSAPEPEPTPDPVTAPAEQPLPEPIPEPAPEPTPEPVPEPTSDPVPTPVEEPPTGSVPTPVSESTPQSPPEPVPQPVSEPITDPALGPPAGTANAPPPVSEPAHTVPVAPEPLASEPNAPESTPRGSDPEAASSEQVPEPIAEPVQMALTSKLSNEWTPGESSEQPVPAAVPETAIPQSSPPDDVMERLASGFAREVDKLRGSFPDQIATLGKRASDLVAGLTRAVSGAVGWLLEGGIPSPVDDPLIPPAAPAAPPPPVPIPVGQSYLAGGSFSGESVSSGGRSEKLIQQFAVLDVLSLPLMQGSERPWTWREPLRPNSAPRPPNERPG
jgi:hypothetical protein